MRRIAIVVAVLLVVGSCGGSESDSVDSWGLSAVSDPVSQEEVNEIFLEMPDELDGLEVYRDDPEHVGFVDYSDGTTTVSVAWMEIGIDRPTTIESLDGMANHDQFSELSRDFESSSVLLHGIVETEDSGHMLWWGDPADGWLFAFAADTADHLNQLVDEFISAASA